MSNVGFDQLAGEVIIIIKNFLNWFISIPGVTVVIPVFLGVYFFYKSLKRLVYTIETAEVISDDIKELVSLKFKYLDKTINGLNVSNILIYNNGRKSINRSDIQSLFISSKNGNIFECIETKEHKPSIVTSQNNKVEIYLENFDGNDFIGLKIFHEGRLEIEGRIKESGEIMNTESKLWLRINFVFVTIILTGFIWASLKIEEDNILSWKWMIIMCLISILVLRIVKFFNSVFFIPNGLISKYVSIKNNGR